MHWPWLPSPLFGRMLATSGHHQGRRRSQGAVAVQVSRFAVVGSEGLGVRTDVEAPPVEDSVECATMPRHQGGQGAGQKRREHWRGDCGSVADPLELRPSAASRSMSDGSNKARPDRPAIPVAEERAAIIWMANGLVDSSSFHGEKLIRQITQDHSQRSIRHRDPASTVYGVPGGTANRLRFA
mgnify:CR=1 FL=1